MTEAQDLAFRKVIKNLSERQAKVYDTIKRIESKNLNITIKMIAHYMGCEKNEISGRLTNLQDKGMIVDTGNMSGHYTIFRRTQPDERESLIEKRQSDKFQNDVRNFTKKWKHKLDDSVIFNLSSYL